MLQHLLFNQPMIQLRIAQLTAPSADTLEEASLIFSGPRFFIALVAGLVLAFGFQLLLTNLSIAAGISYLGSRSDSSSDDSSSSGGSGKIGTALGLWTLFTVSLSLFGACILAVKLSLINNVVLGGIVGLVIWATYFSLMVWISSTTVGSLIGSVVNAATSGFQAIVGTATNAVGAKIAKDQIISTAEAAAAAVRREFTNGIDPESIRENLEDYLARLRPADLNLQGIRQEFEQLLGSSDLTSIADPDVLKNVDRQTFVDLVSSRSDLSKREVDRIVDQLEGAWNQTIGKTSKRDYLSELTDFLRSGQPEQLLSGNLGKQLEQLVGTARSGGQNQAPGGMMQFVNGLMGVVIGRADLSDLDVEKIIGQLKSTRDQLTQQASTVTATLSNEPEPYSIVRADVENYLLNTYFWQLTPETLERDFRSVLYDPQADPTTVRQELEQLGHQHFVELLQSRGLLTPDQIHTLSWQLEGIRLDVLEGVIIIEETEKSQELEMLIDGYLRLAPRETLLNQDALAQDFKPMLEDADVGAERLRDRFSKFDQPTLINFLNQRTDLSFEEKQQIATYLDRIFTIVAADAEGIQQAATARVSAQWQKLGDYLRHTGKDELSPEGIKRDLSTLLDDPQTGAHDLRVRLSKFDRDTLVKLLSQRQDISEADANQILTQVEDNWRQVRYAPQRLAASVTEQYDKVTSTLSDYLRNTGREELNPDGIQRDLKLLLDDPKAGTEAMRMRLSKVDRETLVQLLSQRQDLSEEQVNQVIDEVQETIRGILRTPRRLASRTQAQFQSFQMGLEDYLRNTGKEEFNPEGIKRDLQMLVNDPRLGMERMGDRLSQIDRASMIALLSQREDMSEAEAARIVDQVLATRDQMMAQVQAVQRQIQSAIEGVLSKIRNYLNSLERPELNYDSIRQDVRTLFDDPQAGFDALRSRLSHFDRGTVVALLSSRDDISQADAERIVEQVERTRNSILGRAERVQTEVQRRLDDIKHQAQKQVEDTRKAAAAAAWWLFTTALISAIVSAVAGGLAVST